ncbi:MAG: hypothetical protein LAT68_00025 [Cyclobacteriaceae bacterium]|nr:hypothetical protein [Cyclobacteriaceae bacterium]MCH8514687.1 hypothetical protein [Cyclobacteriaceae bacterium]
MHAIDQLKELDLSEYPIAEIDRLLTSLGPLGIMLTDYHKTPENQYSKEIERAVNNTKEEPEFNKVSRISYKPAKFNSNYLRASTPKNTMFYGSVISEEDFDKEEMKYPRIVGSSEISSLMRNSDVIEGWSRLTFGNWEVTEDISLATIIDPTLEYEHPYLNSLKKKYLDFLKETPENVRGNTVKCLKFLSAEFSKYVSSGNNHEYLISAKFTEIFTKTSNYDGVVYPSVQAKGYGLCVAIHPRAMSKLKLTKVLQCKLTKTVEENGENNFQLLNEKHCLVDDGAETFELNEIEK